MLADTAKFFWRNLRAVQTLPYLENWHVFIANRVRGRIGIPPATNELKLRNGLSFAIHPRSRGLHSVFLDVFHFGTYDRPPGFQIGRRDVVIDIGANIGFFALKASRLASEGSVYAFEPCSFHFDLLKENVRRNGAHNVTASKEAVWGSLTRLELLFSFDDEPDQTSIYNMGGSKKEVVDTVTLEEIFRRHAIQACDFLKMDCEGAEYEILFNTPDAVLGAIRRIALEWHRFEESHQPQELAAFLRGKGFTLIEPEDWTARAGYLFARRT